MSEDKKQTTNGEYEYEPEFKMITGKNETGLFHDIMVNPKDHRKRKYGISVVLHPPSDETPWWVAHLFEINSVDENGKCKSYNANNWVKYSNSKLNEIYDCIGEISLPLMRGMDIDLITEDKILQVFHYHTTGEVEVVVHDKEKEDDVIDD